MADKDKWPGHVHILIWVAILTMASSLAGNAIAWEQWKHPAQTTESDAHPSTPSGGGSVMPWPFLVSSGASLLSLGLLLAVVWKISYRHKEVPIKGGEESSNGTPFPSPTDRSIEKWNKVQNTLPAVVKRTYDLQEVILDGRGFVGCTFTHSTLKYNGTAPTRIEDCRFDAFTRAHITTGHPAISEWMMLLHVLGLLSPTIKVQLQTPGGTIPVIEVDERSLTDARTPKIEIAPSAPQGGMVLFPYGVFQPEFPLAENGDWFHFAVNVKNADASMSICDLVVSLEFEEEGKQTSRRIVERALFRDAIFTFPKKVSCLEAGQSIDCVIAVWSGSVGVQTIRGWSGGRAKAALGDDLYPGIWWCDLTVKAQGIKQHVRYRFKMTERSMSRFMLPPSTPGETG
jgi:hypothetical protein